MDRPIFDMEAQTTRGAMTSGLLWVRATVLIPPELEELFREMVVIADRQQRIEQRKYDSDPISTAINRCLNAGLREYREGGVS